MPQLMPLMWIFSFLMVFLLILVFINLYYEKVNNLMKVNLDYVIKTNNLMKW